MTSCKRPPLTERPRGLSTFHFPQTDACLSLIITPLGPPGSPSPSLFSCYWLTSFRYISQLRLFMVIFQLLSLLFTSLTPCTHAHRASTFKTKTWHYAEHANCLLRWNGREGRWGGKLWAFSGCSACRLLGASGPLPRGLVHRSHFQRGYRQNINQRRGKHRKFQVKLNAKTADHYSVKGSSGSCRAS